MCSIILPDWLATPISGQLVRCENGNSRNSGTRTASSSRVLAGFAYVKTPS
jgi:hypothetical protein